MMTGRKNTGIQRTHSLSSACYIQREAHFSYRGADKFLAQPELKKKKNTYNFYLVIEVPDHVYVFYAYRLYFADKDIYMTWSGTSITR